MDINSEIEKLIKENDVCLFMKGSAETPQCGFSMTVTNILKYLKIFSFEDKKNTVLGIFTYSFSLSFRSINERDF